MKRMYFYLFILFVFVALPLTLGGIYIAQYGSITSNPLWVNGFVPTWDTNGWYNIEPLRTNFFLVLNDVNSKIFGFKIEIPDIPTIPPLQDVTGFFSVLSLLINFVNGLVRLINVSIGIFNAIIKVIEFLFGFLTSVIAYLSLTFQTYGIVQ